MKFALTAAVLGTTAAHGHCPFHHFWQRTTRDCPNRDQTRMMDNHSFIKKFKYTVLNSLVKGIYHDQREAILDDKCFGNWMDVKYKAIGNVFHKIHHTEGGIWGLERQDIKDSSNAAWDLFLDNIDHCGAYKFIYNYYSWCFDNMDTCWYNSGIANRVLDNGFTLMSDTYRVFHAYNHNGDCDSDEQTLAKVGLISETIGSGLSTVKGFEGQWSNTKDV